MRRASLGIGRAWLGLFALLVSVRVDAQSTQAVRASTRVETYVDSDHTTVVRPRASVDAAIGSHWRVAGSYMADVVTSASIDVVTRATQAMSDVRHEASVGATYVDDDGDGTAVSYGFGRERDFLSNVVTVTRTTNLDEARLWVLVTRASFGHSRVGTVVDQSFARDLWTLNASATIARVMSEARVLRVGLELSQIYGFQSSAYRTVRIGDWTAHRSDGTDPEAGAYVFDGVTSTARERTPLERFRGRASIELLQAFGEHGALVLAGAVYADTWQILAAELAPELRYEPRPSWLVRVGGRAYAQSGTWFYRSRYRDVNETGGYVTDDKELGAMRSYAIHAALQAPIRNFRIEARVEADLYRYLEFTLLPRKEAIVASLALTYVR